LNPSNRAALFVVGRCAVDRRPEGDTDEK